MAHPGRRSFSFCQPPPCKFHDFRVKEVSHANGVKSTTQGQLSAIRNASMQMLLDVSLKFHGQILTITLK